MGSFFNASLPLLLTKLTAKSSVETTSEVNMQQRLNLTAEEKIQTFYQEFSSVNANMPSQVSFLKP